MNAVICEGCGRAPGGRDLYCTACGRPLPGREAPAAAGDAAPPGWLVAAGSRGETGFFEPLPSFAPLAEAAAARPRAMQPVAEVDAVPAGEVEPPVPAEGGPGWSVRESPRAPIPLPLPLRTAAEAPGAGDALVLAPQRPRLQALYAPLVALVILSSCGAVSLLVLHVLLHR